MEIFFIVTLILALIVVSAVMAGKNKAETVKYEKESIKEHKNNTTRNMALTIIAIGVTIITLIMVSKEYQGYQQEQQLLKLLYGTTDIDKIEETNNAIMKQTQKIMEETNKMNQQFKKDMEKINHKSREK